MESTSKNTENTTKIIDSIQRVVRIINETKPFGEFPE